MVELGNATCSPVGYPISEVTVQQTHASYAIEVSAGMTSDRRRATWSARSAQGPVSLARDWRCAERRAGWVRTGPLPLVFPEGAIKDPSFAPTFEAYTASPVRWGNCVDLLLNGEQIFPAQARALVKAIGKNLSLGRP